MDKDISKSNYCIFLEDREFNNAINSSGTPIKVKIFKINEQSNLEFINSESWTYERYEEFLNQLNNLEKYEEDNNNQYIKIRDYKSDYYVDMISFNYITYKYFMINLNVPTDYLLK